MKRYTYSSAHDSSVKKVKITVHKIATLMRSWKKNVSKCIRLSCDSNVITTDNVKFTDILTSISLLSRLLNLLA